jgi:hypothetical protein
MQTTFCDVLQILKKITNFFYIQIGSRHAERIGGTSATAGGICRREFQDVSDY